MDEKVPPPPYTENPSAASKTPAFSNNIPNSLPTSLEIHYTDWYTNMSVHPRPSTASTPPLYKLSGAALGTKIAVENTSGTQIAIGKTSCLTCSVTVTLHNTNSTRGPTTFETHTGKFLGAGSPKYTSPAFGNQMMEWRNKAMSTKVKYTLIDGRGMALAKFESAGMKWSRHKTGTLEIEDGVLVDDGVSSAQEKMDEVVVTVLTLFYRKLVEMNMAAVV